MTTDTNGYTIAPNGMNGREQYKVTSPDGMFTQDYLAYDVACAAADRHFRISNITITDRSCMSCSRTFQSTGIGNRLCVKCSTKTWGMM